MKYFFELREKTRRRRVDKFELRGLITVIADLVLDRFLSRLKRSFFNNLMFIDI